MYARPKEQAGVLDFGVSGKLWHGTLLMYDRRTRSLWSQHTSRAIAGPLAGHELEVLESTVTDWKSWRTAHPTTTVVVRPPDDSGERLDPRYLAVGAFIVALVIVVLRRRRQS